MRLIWKRAAAKQVNDTFRYLRERNEAAAYRWLHDVNAAIELLTTLPRMGKRASNPHHEEMRVINVWPYHVFYAVESDSIWILEVKHVRQNTDPQTIRDAQLLTPPAALFAP
jgi:plasmid stabilization system protein ParE